MATEARNHASRPIPPACQRIMPEQAKNQNSHPDNLGAVFCLLNPDFWLLQTGRPVSLSINYAIQTQFPKKSNECKLI